MFSSNAKHPASLQGTSFGTAVQEERLVTRGRYSIDARFCCVITIELRRHLNFNWIRTLKVVQPCILVRIATPPVHYPNHQYFHALPKNKVNDNSNTTALTLISVRLVRAPKIALATPSEMNTRYFFMSARNNGWGDFQSRYARFWAAITCVRTQLKSTAAFILGRQRADAGTACHRARDFRDTRDAKRDARCLGISLFHRDFVGAARGAGA